MLNQQNYPRRFGTEITNTLNNLYETHLNYLIKSEKDNDFLTQLNLISPSFISIFNSEISKNPQFSEKNQYFLHNELRNSKNFLVINSNLEKEYIYEIIINLLKDEKINSLNYSLNFFELQDINIINEKHRAVLIEWLSNSSSKWLPNDETLFLSISIIDRYITKKKITLEKFQLIGIASYLIASKYEHNNIQILDDLVISCKNIYTHKDIIKMEYDILSTLNFDICFISSYKFLAFFYFFCEFNNKKLFYLSQLILEICTLNTEIMTISQSKRAVCSLLIAKKCLQIETRNDNDLLNISNITDFEIREIQKKIILFLNFIIRRDKTNFILEKFSHYKYMKVSDVFIRRKEMECNTLLCY